VARRRGRIAVAAGTNGAGKSAIANEFVGATGGAYFNPDILASKLVAAGVAPEEANAEAWKVGFDALRRAVAHNEDFNFETTLGGRSVSQELHRAIDAGLEVRIWYVGLESPELHIARVLARVKRGGHDIPVAKIRQRYPRSLANLVSFMGTAAEIRVFDNSRETRNGAPAARLVLQMERRTLIQPDRETLLRTTPEWAKPLAAAALGVAGQKKRPRTSGASS
jgi:predicted ABC-type ATPase